MRLKLRRISDKEKLVAGLGQGRGLSVHSRQALYLEPEEKGRKRKRAGEILALAECAG